MTDNDTPATTTRRFKIVVSTEAETLLRHLSETSGKSVARLAAAAVETGIHDVARSLREDTADLVKMLNNAKTIVINDRNLTLQWHKPDGPELGWLDLQNQTPEELRERRKHWVGKVGLDIGEFDTAIEALYGNPVDPARMTTEAVVRRCQHLREAGYRLKPLPETGIASSTLLTPTR